VKRVVGYGKSISPIDDREIEDIRLVVDSKMPQYPWKCLPEGSHVHIMSGPLKGVTGILASKSKDPVLLISISLLQRSVAVQLDNATQLRPLTEQPLAALAGQESQAATALCLAAAGK
jgi:transcription antitermination factor NusG